MERQRFGRAVRGATLAAAALVAVAACGSPSAPELTSPTEIVTAMLASSRTATSTHLAATIEGQLSMAGVGVPIDLSETTAAADLDLARGAAHATFAVPNLFDLAGELVAVDGKTYLKTTSTGPLYQVTDLSGFPIDPAGAKGFIDDLGDFLLGDTVTLAKGDDTGCGSARCYNVTTSLTADELGTLLGSAGGAPAGLPVDITGASVDIAVRVEKEASHHLGGLTLTVHLPGAKAPLTIDLAFSKWNEAVQISAPPADQVKGG